MSHYLWKKGIGIVGQSVSAPISCDKWGIYHLQLLTSVRSRIIGLGPSLPTRVSSKQTKIVFGSNRNKPKQDLFRVCFGLFRETKNKKFWFVSVFRTCIETTETNRTVSWQTETNRNNPKCSEKYPNILSFKLFGWVFCLFRINWNSLFRYRSETTETPKQTVSKQTEKNEKKPKKTKKPRKNPKKP